MAAAPRPPAKAATLPPPTARAAEAVFDLIAGQSPEPKDFNLPVHLVVRGTTGAPPQTPSGN